MFDTGIISYFPCDGAVFVPLNFDRMDVTSEFRTLREIGIEIEAILHKGSDNLVYNTETKTAEV